MNAEITDKNDTAARQDVLYYDGACGVCTRNARRLERVLAKRGIALAPLQSPGAAERLNLMPEQLLNEMRLLTANGRVLSGGDACLYAMRRVWWAWPLYAVFNLPGFHFLFCHGYRWFTDRRYRLGGTCEFPRKQRDVRGVSKEDLP